MTESLRRLQAAWAFAVCGGLCFPVAHAQGAPAAAGEICGTIRVQGRALPSGFARIDADQRRWEGLDPLGGAAPHPGPTVRSLVRVRDGAFCIRGVAPGNYRLRVAPPGSFDMIDLPVAYRGLGPLDQYRLSVPAGGPAVVYGPTGVPVLEKGPLPIEYRPPAPGPDGGTLEGRASFPRGVRADMERDPILVIAQVGFPVYCQWMTAAGGAPVFSLQARSGQLLGLQAWSRRWGMAALRPAVWDDEKGHPELRARHTLTMEMQMRPAGSAAGVVRLPDGRPFSPERGAARWEDQRMLFITFSDLLTHDLGSAIVDEEGRFEVSGIPQGLRVVAANWLGGGFRWSVGPARLRWVGAAQTTAVDIPLSDWAAVRFAPQATGLAPLSAGGRGDRQPVERWVIGLSTGAPAPDWLSPLALNEPPPFALLQGPGGKWKPIGSIAPPGQEVLARAAPAVYDVYLVERTNPLLFPSDPSLAPYVRVLAALKGVALAPGSATELRFSEPYYPGGKAGLRGTLRGSRITSLDSLRQAKTVADLSARMAPRVDLYDAAGRYAGSAFSDVPAREVHAMSEALGTGDSAAIERLFNGRSLAFRIAGLASGTYRARIAAHDQAERERELVLTEEPFPALDIDLDAP